MGDVMYHVLHRRRVTTMAGGCSVLDHNLRIKFVSDSEDTINESVELPDYIDAESMQYNVMKGCLSRDEFCAEYQKRLDNARLKRKIQRNASRVIETVISSSHAFCEDWKENPESRSTIKNYLEDAVEWEFTKHGDVALSVTYHWDETTPHVHLLSVPLVPYLEKTTNDVSLKFSSSEFFGSRGDLIRMHSEFHDEVGKKYGLERGEFGSRSSHRELRDYKNWEREQRAILKAMDESLVDRERQNHEQQQKIAEIEKVLLQREQEVKKQSLKLDSDTRVLQAKHKEFETIIIKSNQGIPIIPEPPFVLSRSKIKTWVDSIQENVTKAFRSIKAAYETLVVKYNKAVSEIQQLRSANKQLHDEYQIIRNDLLKKPLSEIQAQRDFVLSKKEEGKAKYADEGREDHGHSR